MEARFSTWMADLAQRTSGWFKPPWVRVLGLLTGLIAFGTMGYYLLEHYSWLDALYMAVITISTVGFGEVRPLSTVGRCFTVVLILVGVGTAVYAFNLLGDYLISGELEGTLRRRRLMRQLRGLKRHFLICGCGRIGAQVALELQRLHIPFVVIDRHLEHVEMAQQHDMLAIHGDPTDEEILQMAGIDRARGVVAVLDTDADNLFLVLTARSMNEKLFIVAQAVSEASEKKLYKAGADRVVSPFIIAGHRITAWLVRPYVVSFLDTVMRSKALGEMWLEQVRVAEGSELVGKSLAEADIRARTGANVLAIIRDGHRMDWSPQLRIQPYDVLIILGQREHIEHIARLAQDEDLLRQLRQSAREMREGSALGLRLKEWLRSHGQD